MNKFKLSHVVLYAKGWYKITDDIWEDLANILVLDNYNPWNKSDVFSIIISAFQSSGIYRITELKEVLVRISPSECWKFGYYVSRKQRMS